jgi:CheY-like chemotaxis protein
MERPASSFSERPIRQQTEGLALPKAIILVVESEALIRMSAVQTLEDAGYSVPSASNAVEAIKIMEGCSEIRAVLTDINMSGSVDGLALAHAIRNRWPPVHLIVTSGRHIGDRTIFPTGTRFVRKPYGGSELVAVLENLLLQGAKS